MQKPRKLRPVLTKPEWLQQLHLNESEIAYNAFCLYYKNQKPLLQVCKEKYGSKYKGKIRQWQEWSARFAWQARRAAYFAEIELQEAAENAEEIKKMRKKHAKSAAASLKFIDLVTERVIQRVKDDNGDGILSLEGMELKDALSAVGRLLGVAPRLMEAESTARGENPTQNLNVVSATITAEELIAETVKQVGKDIDFGEYDIPDNDEEAEPEAG